MPIIPLFGNKSDTYEKDRCFRAVGFRTFFLRFYDPLSDVLQEARQEGIHRSQGDTHLVNRTH